MRPVVLVMGVAGSGKTLIGERLAQRLDVPFLEGDAFHSPENVAKMSRGVPLTDDDRLPWLKTIAAELQRLSASDGAVVACSALKKSYREILRVDCPGLQTLLLGGDRELIMQRMGQRSGHFMPTSLLDSQFATLEPPDDREQHVLLDISKTPEEIIDAAFTAVTRKEDSAT